MGQRSGRHPRVYRYKAGPYKYGSKGILLLKVSTAQGMKTQSWSAQSGLCWDWTNPNGTMPPGNWRTATTWRIKQNGAYQVEGVPTSALFGAYLIHVEPHPYRVRHPDRFHIHGDWGPAAIPPYYSGPNHVAINGEDYYHGSNGCIILHRADLAPSATMPANPRTLADWWVKYVLNGAAHGKASVHVPLKVQYSSHVQSQ